MLEIVDLAQAVLHVLLDTADFKTVEKQVRLREGSFESLLVSRSVCVQHNGRFSRWANSALEHISKVLEVTKSESFLISAGFNLKGCDREILQLHELDARPPTGDGVRHGPDVRPVDRIVFCAATSIVIWVTLDS